jgi:hypothetical protein
LLLLQELLLLAPDLLLLVLLTLLCAGAPLRRLCHQLLMTHSSSHPAGTTALQYRPKLPTESFQFIV